MFIKTLKSLMNYNIKNLAQEFIGVFMRDTLLTKVNDKECEVINLNVNKNNSAHWVCYYKNISIFCYFDSFRLYSPFELQKYMNTAAIEFSNSKI